LSENGRREFQRSATLPVRPDFREIEGIGWEARNCPRGESDALMIVTTPGAAWRARHCSHRCRFFESVSITTPYRNRLCVNAQSWTHSVSGGVTS